VFSSHNKIRNVLSYANVSSENHFTVDFGVPRGRELTPIRMEMNLKGCGSYGAKLSWGSMNPTPHSVLGPAVLDLNDALINLTSDDLCNPTFMLLYVYSRFALQPGAYVVRDPVIAGDSTCWICLYVFVIRPAATLFPEFFVCVHFGSSSQS
jgi:hypothetical protein